MAISPEQLTNLAVKALDDLKGETITTLDVRQLTSICDYMVICTGNSNRHVRSLAYTVVEKVKQAGLKVRTVEGEAEGEWVLVDLNDVIIHVMQHKIRDFYNLEKLWVTNTERQQSAEL